MKLQKVYVKNYKYVEDSGEFLIDNVTCLVGKNENSKTAILEALYLLNPQDPGEIFDRDDQYPRRHLANYLTLHPGGDAEVINTLWELEEAQLEELAGVLGVKCLKDVHVRVSKGYKNLLSWSINCDEPAVIAFLVEKYLKSDEEKISTQKVFLQDLKEYLIAKTHRTDDHNQLLANINKILRDGSLSNHIATVLGKHLPKFFMFSTHDEINGNIQIEDLNRRLSKNEQDNQDKVFLAFLALAGIKPAEITAVKQYEPLNAKLEEASKKISAETFKFWTHSHHLTVHVKLADGKAGDPAPFNKGHVIRIHFYDEHHQVTAVDAHSSGFVWFFSFLSLFFQVKKQFGNILILLDEPGLRLHGKAQYDLLRYIQERLEPNHQIIYTTHSPFMIDAEDERQES